MTRWHSEGRMLERFNYWVTTTFGSALFALLLVLAFIVAFW